MKRYIEGIDRQAPCLAQRLEDTISADNPVRAVDLFVDRSYAVRLSR